MPELVIALKRHVGSNITKAIMDLDISHINSLAWEQSRSVSDGSMSTTNSEQLALVGFAHRLGSKVLNKELGIADETDVRKEARLLMSLSCSSPTHIIEETGRITPSSDISSCYSTASRRDLFTFSCPSLSLEDHSQRFEDESSANTRDLSSETPAPAALLGRVLKVDDRDAMRLSSEAMARNIMQSYQKAIEWRIKSWATALGTILVEREKTLKEEDASTEELKALVNSGEARLITKLQELAEKIQVLDASTNFKVLPQRVPQTEASGPVTKKQRLQDDMASLEEHEYMYHVAHLLTLESSLNILTPGTGYIQIDLQVPGAMKGSFLSSEIEGEQLTDVMIEVNTEMLASMIEKSSRIAVRSSVEALLKEELDEKPSQASEAKEAQAEATPISSPPPTCTPKRKLSGERVSGIVVVTPRETSSPSSFGESDNEDKPVVLSIPDDFSSGHSKPTLRMLTPQPSRARDISGIPSSTACLAPKKMPLPTVVTPHKTSTPSVAEGKSPNLPFLVEAACAAMSAK